MNVKTFLLSSQRYLSTLFASVFLITASFANATDVAKLLSSGNLAFQQGQFQEAIYAWEQVLPNISNTSQGIDIRLHLATAYRFLGLINNALNSTKQALDLVQKNEDKVRQSKILTRLSELYLLSKQDNKFGKAQDTIKDSIELACQIDNPLILANALNHYGYVLSIQELPQHAWAAYHKALQVAPNPRVRAMILINQMKALLQWKGEEEISDEKISDERFECDTEDKVPMMYTDVQEKYERLLSVLKEVQQLPESYEKALNLLALVRIGLDILPESKRRRYNKKAQHNLQFKLYEIITKVLQFAQNTPNKRLQSFAYGYLGELYEIDKRYSEAERLTRKALSFAKQIHSLDILYRWQWQQGRILKAQDKVKEAIPHYQLAVDTLEEIQAYLTIGYPTTTYYFGKSIQPIYFGLIDLLLRQEELMTAIETIEKFKEVELENYFREDCITGADKITLTSAIKNLKTTKAAVLYPIALPQRLELLLLLPNGEMEQEINTRYKDKSLRRQVKRFTSRSDFSGLNKTEGKRLYNLLIRPITKYLSESKIDTLIIVPDGILRTVPFAALYDNKKEKYLIEKYALVTIPGFTFTNPQPIPSKSANIFLGGVSQEVRDFDALPEVPDELDKIRRIFNQAESIPSKMFLDQDFTTPKIKRKLKTTHHHIIHLATHGEFNKVPEKSFLLTFDDKLTMNQLEELMTSTQFSHQPIDLLVLSACETAKSGKYSDERAALGLAGITVKAGVKSAVAGLWKVESGTASLLFPIFYQHLKHNSKAKALQEAQRKFIQAQDPQYKQYQDPRYWAPFLLIGNWY